jgi:GT2 family glycosyltransferase
MNRLDIMKQNVAVSIITVGMNHLKYLREFLPSVFSTISYSFEMIYVDNCSTDGSCEYIKEHFPQVLIIENKTPKGFGANNNIGVRKASGKYIAIINPDIILEQNSLKLLLTFMENNPSVGIAVPQLLNPNYSIQSSVRRFITLEMLLWRFITRGDDAKMNKANSHYLYKDLDVSKIQPIDWAIGAAMVLAREFYEELEGFDEDYFLYMEDEDLCLRSWKRNKAVVYIPDSKMIHNHLRGSLKIGKKMFYHFKSMFLFFRKHGFFLKRKDDFSIDNLAYK